ncbi:MAG TPA: type II toxin-antitoxin system VapC family toxin [Stellaceae bacterium]
MVIDSSALIALLLGEAETVDFVAAIAAASSRLVSAPTYVETAIVMVARSGLEAWEKLDRLLVELAIEVSRSRAIRRTLPSPHTDSMGRAAAMPQD